MRSMKFLAVAAATVALFGCNTGQPRINGVAVDVSPLFALPATCFSNNEIVGGSQRATVTNWRSETDWVIWDGVNAAGETKQYLDLGEGQTFQLGDADPVTVIGVIEGADNVFMGNQQVTRLPDANNNNYSNVRTKTITVTFEEQGTSPKGTIDLVSNYTCTNCAPGELEQPGNKTCSARLNFVGRRIDVDQQTSYDNGL